MILNKTTDNLTIELSSAITTNQLDCYSIVKINGVNEPKEFNTNGTNATIGINKIYIETDY